MTCIPRPRMPQVRDVCRALDALRTLRVGVDLRYVGLHLIRTRQCPTPFDFRRWDDAHLDEPLVVARGLILLDGHHRAERRLQLGYRWARAYCIDLPFNQARRTLLAIPEVCTTKEP